MVCPDPQAVFLAAVVTVNLFFGRQDKVISFFVGKSVVDECTDGRCDCVRTIWQAALFMASGWFVIVDNRIWKSGFKPDPLRKNRDRDVVKDLKCD